MRLRLTGLFVATALQPQCQGVARARDRYARCAPTRMKWLVLIGLGCLLSVSLAATASAAPVYIESGGVVSMEAEGFSANDNSGSPNWSAGTSGFSNATGGAFMHVLPNLNTGHSAPDVLLPPYLDYEFQVGTAGTYRLYLRFDAPSAGPPPDDLPMDSDSLYASILGESQFYRFAKEESSTTSRSGSLDGDFATDPWQGDGLINSDSAFTNPDAATWSLGVGDHTLRVAFREDGVGLDKLVLQLVSVESPLGDGPPVSAIVPEPLGVIAWLPGCAALVLLQCSRRRRAPYRQPNH